MRYRPCFLYSTKKMSICHIVSFFAPNQKWQTTLSLLQKNLQVAEVNKLAHIFQTIEIEGTQHALDADTANVCIYSRLHLEFVWTVCLHFEINGEFVKTMCTYSTRDDRIKWSLIRVARQLSSESIINIRPSSRLSFSYIFVVQRHTVQCDGWSFNLGFLMHPKHDDRRFRMKIVDSLFLVRC